MFPPLPPSFVHTLLRFSSFFFFTSATSPHFLYPVSLLLFPLSILWFADFLIHSPPQQAFQTKAQLLIFFILLCFQVLPSLSTYKTILGLRLSQGHELQKWTPKQFCGCVSDCSLDQLEWLTGEFNASPCRSHHFFVQKINKQNNLRNIIKGTWLFGHYCNH